MEYYDAINDVTSFSGMCKSSFTDELIGLSLPFYTIPEEDQRGVGEGEAQGPMRTGVCKWYNVTKGWVRDWTYIKDRSKIEASVATYLQLIHKSIPGIHQSR